MTDHTSKTLTLDDDIGDCWCSHPEERHHVVWRENKGESTGRPVSAIYPHVHCFACSEEERTLFREHVQTRVTLLRRLRGLIEESHKSEALEAFIRSQEDLLSAIEAKAGNSFQEAMAKYEKSDQEMTWIYELLKLSDDDTHA